MHKFRPTLLFSGPTNSCIECGRTEEWHDKQTFEWPSAEAAKYLESKSLKNHQLYEMFLNLLTEYISDKRKIKG